MESDLQEFEVKKHPRAKPWLLITLCGLLLLFIGSYGGQYDNMIIKHICFAAALLGSVAVGAACIAYVVHQFFVRPYLLKKDGSQLFAISQDQKNPDLYWHASSISFVSISRHVTKRHPSHAMIVGESYHIVISAQNTKDIFSWSLSLSQIREWREKQKEHPSDMLQNFFLSVGIPSERIGYDPRRFAGKVQ